MATQKRKLRIATDGTLVSFNPKLQIWETRSFEGFNWDQITPGYKRESRRNYKNHKLTHHVR